MDAAVFKIQVRCQSAQLGNAEAGPQQNDDLITILPVLLRLINAENEIGSTMALENFILGFRLGVRMILEALDEDDGSLIDPNKEG